MMERAVFLSFHEFWMLMLAAEKSGGVFFKEAVISEMSENEIARTIMAMSSKGMIEADGNCIRFSEENATLIRILKNAQGILVEKGYEGRIPVSCIFISNGEALRIQLDEHKSDSMRLQISPIDAICEECVSYPFMPQEENSREISDIRGDINAEREEILLKISRYLYEGCVKNDSVYIVRGYTYDRIIFKCEDIYNGESFYRKDLIRKIYKEYQNWESIFREKEDDIS